MEPTAEQRDGYLLLSTSCGRGIAPRKHRWTVATMCMSPFVGNEDAEAEVAELTEDQRAG